MVYQQLADMVHENGGEFLLISFAFDSFHRLIEILSLLIPGRVLEKVYLSVSESVTIC